jgi:hypothetical protein
MVRRYLLLLFYMLLIEVRAVAYKKKIMSCLLGCPRFAYLLDYLSVSLRLYFLEGTGRRRCFLPSASKSQI